MEKMKILFLTNLPSPYRVNFFSELGKLCDLTVIYERRSATDRNEKWTAEKENTYREITLKGFETGNDSAFCPGVLRFLKKGAYDHIVVSVYSTPTAMLAIEYMRLKRIPFIISTDGGFISKESKIKYLIKKHFMGAASYWLSTGDKATEYLEYYGADRSKTYKYPFTSLLQSDLESADHYSQEDKEKLKEKLQMKERYILLSVGRFSYEAGYGKGYDTLLKAAEKISTDIGIYIVGDEPTAEFVKWKQDRHLDNVHFIGFKEKTYLSEYYAAADAFVLLTKKDVWGLVINEAMSYALPLVTTTQCLAGVELVVHGENGYLVEAGDVDETVKYINFLFSSKSKKTEMGEINRQKITEYTIEKMALRHVDVFERIQRKCK